MKSEEPSAPTREETVRGGKGDTTEDTEIKTEGPRRNWLRRLTVVLAVPVGASAGLGIALLIVGIAETITQPAYSDMMLGWWLIALVVCVPLFAALFGFLFHRLGRRFPRAAPYTLASQVAVLAAVAVFVGPTLLGPTGGGPMGIAVDGADNLYVLYTSSTDARIEKHDANGELLSQWALADSGDESFSRWSLRGIAADEAGNVYVLRHRLDGWVERYSANGELSLQWDLGRFFVGTGISHSGMAIDESGSVHIIESGQVRRFSAGGDLLGTWGSGQFNSASGIALDRSGNVFVSETWNHRVQKFDPSGQLLTRWGSEGSADGQFQRPSAIAVDASDNVYVVDSRNYRVQRFSADGEFLTKWGSRGSGDGQFKWATEIATGVAVDRAGNVYVLDVTSGRVQKFSASGQFLARLDF